MADRVRELVAWQLYQMDMEQKDKRVQRANSFTTPPRTKSPHLPQTNGYGSSPDTEEGTRSVSSPYRLSRVSSPLPASLSLVDLHSNLLASDTGNDRTSRSHRNSLVSPEMEGFFQDHPESSEAEDDRVLSPEMLRIYSPQSGFVCPPPPDFPALAGMRTTEMNEVYSSSDPTERSEESMLSSEDDSLSLARSKPRKAKPPTKLENNKNKILKSNPRRKSLPEFREVEKAMGAGHGRSSKRPLRVPKGDDRRKSNPEYFRVRSPSSSSDMEYGGRQSPELKIWPPAHGRLFLPQHGMFSPVKKNHIYSRHDGLYGSVPDKLNSTQHELVPQPGKMALANNHSRSLSLLPQEGSAPDRLALSAVMDTDSYKVPLSSHLPPTTDFRPLSLQPMDDGCVLLIFLCIFINCDINCF